MEESKNFQKVGGVGLLREDGGEMTDGTVDPHLTKEEAPQPTAIMKILKTMNQNAQAIKSY